MCRRHSGLQQFKEACVIARDHGMVIAEQHPATNAPTQYVVYRRTPAGTVRLGQRADPAALRHYVAKLANFH